MIVFSSEQLSSLNAAKARERAVQEADRLSARYSAEITLTPAELADLIERCQERMRRFGIRDDLSLSVAAAWETFYGPRFETRDPEGQLLAICEGDADAMTKFVELAARMRALGPDMLQD